MDSEQQPFLLREPKTGRRVKVFGDEDREAFEARGYVSAQRGYESPARQSSSETTTPPAKTEGGAGEQPVDLGSMTVAALKDLAAKRGVDLEGRTRKAEIIEALTTAASP